MSRIFLSHSSADELEAVAVKYWLTENGWDDIFLDVDSERGLVAGERWQAALRRAADRCEAVVFIISPAWARSKWCLAEFLLAKSLHKLIFGIVIKEVPIAELPTEMTAEWQLCQLIGSGPTETIRVTHRDKPAETRFLIDGLKRLGSGLQSAGLAASYFAWPPKDDASRAPYRGLEPLDVQDTAIFFGRDLEILQGLDRLRGMRAAGDQSLFVILGASGAGKSSFLRAGLLSRLMRDDRHFFPLEAIRPERSPLFGERGLAQAISKANGHLHLAPANSGDLKAAIREGAERFAALLRDIQCAARNRLVGLPDDGPPPTLVLPIDQAEELFNADATEEARTFLGLIGAVLRSGLPDTSSELRVPLIVVFTIRSDRYEPLQTAPELAGLKTFVFDALRPMPTAQFKEVITGPASRATLSGTRLEVKPDLVLQLLADCAQGADTLPLLSLVLARLYRDYGSGGDLRLDAYQVMGGMTDVIQTEAESILDADPDTRNAQLHSLHVAFIPWLATINPANDQPMRRVAYMSDLPLASRPLIQALIEKRLLLSDVRDGEQVVEVAHESLLRQWNALAKWLDEEREDLKEADRLEQAAAAWTKNEEKADWLMEGERLAGAEALAAKPAYSKRLEPAGQFLLASRDREIRRAEEKEHQREAEIRGETERVAASRLRRRALQLTVAVVVALLMFFSAGYAFINANGERQKALLAQREANGLRLTAESLAIANGARAGGDERALLQVLAARKTAPNSEVDAGLLGVLIAMRDTRKLWTAGAPIVAVAFSPDGARIVSGGDDKMLRVWDASTGQPMGAPMQGHTRTVTSVAFSPDGTHIVSGSNDETVRLWDAKSGMPVGSPLLGHNGPVWSVAFSPDGKRIASGAGDKTLRLWDADTGRPVSVSLLGHDSLAIKVATILEGDRIARIPNQLRHEGAVTSVAFSPDGTRIVSGSSDRTVRLWDAHNGKPIGAPLEGHTLQVLSVAFSPDGTRIVSGSLDKTLRLWDASTRQQIGAPLDGNENAVASVAFSPDGKRIVSGGWDKTLRLWDASTGYPIGAPMQTYGGRINSVAFSPDGARIVSGGSDKMLRMWKGKPGESIGTPLGMHQDAVFMVSFSPDGTRIVSGSFDKSLQLWNASTGSPIGKRMRGHDEAVTSAAFNPAGTLIVSGSLDKTLRLWDANSGQVVGRPLRGHEEGVYGAAFSPDGTRIVSGGSDGTLRLWDASTGQSTGTPMRWDQGTAYSVSFSPDGKHIASSFEKQTLQLWDTSTGRPAGPPMRGHKGSVTSVAFSPDGRRIVSSGDLTLRLWDAHSGQPIGEPMLGHQAQVQSVAFSPDGTYIVSGGDDKTLRLWDASTGALIGAPMQGHRSTVFSVAFSPDGRRIVSGGQDRTVRLWPAPKIWPEELCGKVTRNMSHKEWDNWVSKDMQYVCQCPGLPIPQDNPNDDAKPEACPAGKS